MLNFREFGMPETQLPGMPTLGIPLNRDCSVSEKTSSRQLGE
jgi:hypothetical protein